MTDSEIKALKELIALLRADNMRTEKEMRSLRQDIKDLRSEIMGDRDKCQKRHDEWLASNTRKIDYNAIEIAKMSSQAKTAGGAVAIIVSIIIAAVNRMVP